MSALDKVFFDFAEVGEVLASSPSFFIPFGVWTEAPRHEGFADDLNQKFVMIRVLEDKAVVSFGEWFGVFQVEHDLS